MSARRGLLAALLVGGLALAVQYAVHRDDIVRYDDRRLPGFDANVYVAMAEHPAFFTLPPWGYRLFTPWLVHLLPLQSTADAFLALTLGALLLASGLLHLLLRRFGLRPTASLLGVLAFGLAPPTGAALSYVFLTDPLTLVFELLLLLALEAGAGGAALAVISVLGVLNKEAFFLFLPGIFFALRPRQGWRRAAATTLSACGAGLLTRLSLQAWAPTPLGPISVPDGETLWPAAYLILAGWRDWWAPSFLWLLGPLALLGSLRERARPVLVRHGYLLGLTLALPFAASIYTGDRNPMAFFAQDVPRLLLLALPLLLVLAAAALGQLGPQSRSEPQPAGYPLPPSGAESTSALAKRRGIWMALLALGLALSPLVLGDRYRRDDLRGPRDGRLVLALCNQSVAFARRLDRGRTVRYEIEERRFSPPRADPRHLERMRWFLREGFGHMPHYSTGPVVMQDVEAAILLPCLHAADLELTLVLSAATEIRIDVRINRDRIGEAEANPTGIVSRLRVPAQVLFRGDNRIWLVDSGRSGVRLHDVAIRRLPADEVQ